jgi:hypothetical protein
MGPGEEVRSLPGVRTKEARGLEGLETAECYDGEAWAPETRGPGLESSEDPRSKVGL